jgi:hypothetical protein
MSGKEGEGDGSQQTSNKQSTAVAVIIDTSATTQGFDVFARRRVSSSKGRGSGAGWVACPLCPPKSSKRFSGGRGIAAHLHAVHTPWKAPPKKKESKLTKKQWKKRKRALDEQNDSTRVNGETPALSTKRQKCASTDIIAAEAQEVQHPGPDSEPNLSSDDLFEPTPAQVAEWGKRVLDLTAQAEVLLKEVGGVQQSADQGQLVTTPKAITAGQNRTGQAKAESYMESLPTFVQHAANGHVDRLKGHLADANCSPPIASTSQCLAVWDLLHSYDRNGSSAQEWAAGKGHLECLIFLIELTKECHSFMQNNTRTHTHTEGKVDDWQATIKKRKKREQKSPLHWAARHGHEKCVQYLIHSELYKTDERSGDGTTPLHYACYGGHLDTVKLLVEKYDADPGVQNQWGCDVSHWIAMSTGEASAVTDICHYLRHTRNVPFHLPQNQGQTPLHKAAQKKNVHVIKWLLSDESNGAKLSPPEKEKLCKPDMHGNLPSGIYLLHDGEQTVADSMKSLEASLSQELKDQT